MANINLYEAYLQKLRKFGVNDSSRFRASFADSVNMVYSEFNGRVFGEDILAWIDSIDDVIDNRLMSFDSVTFGANALIAMGNREYWAAEWELEILSATNGMTDTIDTTTDVVLSIANGVFTVTQTGVVVASATLPVFDTGTVRFESTSAGNALTVDGSAVELTYTTGDAETSLPIVVVTSRVIDGFSGMTLNRNRFLSAASSVMDFPMNEGTGLTLTDDIGSLTAAILPDPAVWATIYIEPSSSLDKAYYMPFMLGLDYYIQLSGEWAIEDDKTIASRWYASGITAARNTFQQKSTYTNPLGI